MDKIFYFVDEYNGAFEEYSFIKYMPTNQSCALYNVVIRYSDGTREEKQLNLLVDSIEKNIEAFSTKDEAIIFFSELQMSVVERFASSEKMFKYVLEKAIEPNIEKSYYDIVKNHSLTPFELRVFKLRLKELFNIEV